jgi:hypothetical protein
LKCFSLVFAANPNYKGAVDDQLHFNKFERGAKKFHNESPGHDSDENAKVITKSKFSHNSFSVIAISKKKSSKQLFF